MTRFAVAALSLMVLLGVGCVLARLILGVAHSWFDAVLGEQHETLSAGDER